MSSSDAIKRKLEREVKARKQAEAILEKKALELFSANEDLKRINRNKDALLDAVSKALITLYEGEDLFLSIRNAIDIIGEVSEADRISITFTKFEDSDIIPNYVYSYCKDSTKLLSVIFDEDNEKKFQFQSLFDERLKEEKIIVYSLKNEDQQVKEALHALSTNTISFTPIQYGDEEFGAIGIEFFDQDYEWTKNDETILRAFAAGVESAIQRYYSKIEIVAQREFYESVLNSIPSDIVVFTPDHRYKFVNPVAVKNPEIRKWLVGKDDFEYAEYRNKPKKVAEKRREVFNKVVEKREPFSFEEKLKTAEGKTEWKLRRLFPVFDEFTNALEMVIGYALDITDIKETQEELITAREQAEESKRLKQKFLANMSHEIRTPMNGVIGIVHLLERTTLDKEQRKYLNILKDSSEHLLHIINEILDVSKIEEGKLVLVKTPILIENIIEGVVENLKNRIRDKKLGLEVKGLEIFDSHLLADPVRIRQIFLNLLSNAIKFTHKGQISVICKNIKKTAKKHSFSIEIKDTGIGIPEDKIDQIFEAFDQASLDTTTQYGGTGLGLNIVNELIQKMDAEIEVQSKEQVGSSFKVNFTFDKVSKEKALFEVSDQTIQKNEELSGINILVADDHEVNFTIANEIITGWGGNVHYAKDGEEALEYLLMNDIDLILMDMQMPNVDGIEATKMIRLLDKPKSEIPIVAMTAAALPEEREKCLQSGMNDYIAKPYNPGVLFNILSNYLLDESIPSNGSTSGDTQTNTEVGFDLNYLKELSGNNTKFILEMINSFKNDMPEMIEGMFHGISNNDYSEIAKLSHKSKSLAGYLGCNDLRSTLKDIEEISEKKQEMEIIEENIKRASKQVDKLLEELNGVEI